MSKIEVDCKGIQGEINLPLSKSYVQRFLIAAFLAGELETAVARLKTTNEMDSLTDFAEDIKIAIAALRDLQNDIEELEIDCGNSGAIIRMLKPVAAALGKKVIFNRGESLNKRPVAMFDEELSCHVKDGILQPGEFHVSGNISSQFASGLLFALPILDGDSTLIIDGKLQSAPYLEMTIYTLEKFGVKILHNGQCYTIRGGQKYIFTDDCSELLESDWSAAAMWICADYLLGGKIKLQGLKSDSLQGDKIMLDIIDDIRESKAREIDVSNCPDIAPCIALAAVKSNSVIRLVNAARLRYKECDRLQAIVEILSQLGADIKGGEDWIEINGKVTAFRNTESKELLLPGSDEPVNTFGDHRMVMMATMASIICEKPVAIRDAETVAKSYPHFFEKIKNLGGEVN